MKGSNMTSKERAKIIEDLIADPDRHRREVDDEVRRRHPQLTDEQIAAAWGPVRAILGW